MAERFRIRGLARRRPRSTSFKCSACSAPVVQPSAGYELVACDGENHLWRPGGIRPRRCAPHRAKRGYSVIQAKRVGHVWTGKGWHWCEDCGPFRYERQLGPVARAAFRGFVG